MLTRMYGVPSVRFIFFVPVAPYESVAVTVNE